MKLSSYQYSGMFLLILFFFQVSAVGVLLARPVAAKTPGQPLELSDSTTIHQKNRRISLGYRSTGASEISGAMSTAYGYQLEAMPVANFSQTLAGVFAGLTTQEAYTEPARATTDLFIRGLSTPNRLGPLVVIDGIPVSFAIHQALEFITPAEIESITILKDASTQALYGIQGGAGVITIETKRGREGPLVVTARADYSVQQPTTRPTFFPSAEYAQLRNLAAQNDGMGANYFFSESDIDKFRAGNDPNYPTNDWYDRYVKHLSSMQRISVDMAGGNEKVKYFSHVNFLRQGGYFNTDQTRYDPNPQTIWGNVRSNIDINFNRYLSAFVRLAGNVRRGHAPGGGTAGVYQSIFQLPPSLYGPLTPENESAPESGGQVITTDRVQSPTYGLLNRTGYTISSQSNMTSQLGLGLDLGFLTNGLEAESVFAYQASAFGMQQTYQDYERWVRTADLSQLAFQKKGIELNTPLAYGKSHFYYYHLSYKGHIKYNRTFDRHQVGGLLYMFYQNLTTDETESPGLLPYNRVNYGFDANYSYDQRYFVHFAMGYSGSEQYARGARYTATPAAAAAWLVSNESFLKGSPVVSRLKVRGSYGLTANDRSGITRYAYLDNVTYGRGGPMEYLQYTVYENQIGNPDIRAEVIKKANVGLDLELFKSLSFSVDAFKEVTDNAVVSSTSNIPMYQGVALEAYPAINGGRFENRGYELSAQYTAPANKRIQYWVGGNFAYAENKVVNMHEPRRGEDYAYRNVVEGYPYGQQLGYLVDHRNGSGFFTSAEEIASQNLTYSFGQPRVGDLIYRDLNGDNVIDERDMAPLGTGMIPRITGAFNGGFRVGSFEFNALIQGVGMYSSPDWWVNEEGYDGVFTSFHRASWTPERFARGETITSPALSTRNSVNHVPSDYTNLDLSYVRLRNVTLAYNLSERAADFMKARHIRLSLSGQNLFTLHHHGTRDFGPEGGGYWALPVYKVYNLGVNIGF